MKKNNQEKYNIVNEKYSIIFISDESPLGESGGGSHGIKNKFKGQGGGQEIKNKIQGQGGGH